MMQTSAASGFLVGFDHPVALLPMKMFFFAVLPLQVMGLSEVIAVVGKRHTKFSAMSKAKKYIRDLSLPSVMLPTGMLIKFVANNQAVSPNCYFYAGCGFLAVALAGQSTRVRDFIDTVVSPGKDFIV
jgi:hypothetical protein